MVETVTLNYGWVKPEIAGSPSSWGSYLNDDLDSIDALMFVGQQGLAPIGAIVMFAGFEPPTNWLWCNGGVYNLTDIPLLAPIMQNAWPGGDGVTTTAVPNLWSGRSPIGYDGGGWTMGLSGGEFTHTLSWGEMPPHNHGVSDPTHAHSVYDPTHVHGVGDPGHGHNASQDAHNHTVPNAPLFSAGSGVPGGSGAQLGNQTTSTAQPAVHVNAAGTGISIAGAGTGISLYGAATGISTQNAGGGAAHNNMQPYTVVGFIIRFQ